VPGTHKVFAAERKKPRPLKNGVRFQKNDHTRTNIVDKFKIYYYTCAINGTSMEIIMRIVNFSEARNNLKTVLNQVADDADYTIITRRDSEDAVVMSLETFNSFMETFYLLRSPANAAHLTKSIQQFKNGKVQERDLIDG